MNIPRFVTLSASLLFGVCFQSGGAAEEDIRWLVEYDGKSVPAAPGWTSHGSPAAEVKGDELQLQDNATESDGFFRAAWAAQPGDAEVIVEVTVRVEMTTGVVKHKPDSKTLWPWRDGAPVSLLVSDGKHQEGLVFYADRVTTWTDRFIVMDAAKEFHTYRLVIRGTEMSLAVDGKVQVKGQNAFWKPAEAAEAFVQFGSNSKYAKGSAAWRSLRLGVRKAAGPAEPATVKITMSKPWPITRPDLKTKPTRPYVYATGKGLLAMSLAEGPDAIYEPYGVMTSTDAGKTWLPMKGLDVTEFAPLPMLKLKDGSVLGASRWVWRAPDGGQTGRVVRWDAGMTKFDLSESRIHLPPEYNGEKVTITCERRLFEEDDGALLMSGYTRTGPNTDAGKRVGRRYSHLVRSTDGGATWNHHSLIGPGAEPAVVKTGPGKFTALLRTGPFKPFDQTFSEDGGKTWSKPVALEEGSVCADLVMMSNGLLACSYGRPVNSLMFSADGGRTWSSHHVITDKTGFNYSGIVEVSPGRLLYVHDAGGLQGLYVDVERVPKPVTDFALRTAKELKPTRKVVYKKAGNRELEMHLFEPAGHNPTDRRPCFLAIHGGGWTAGTPDVVYCVADHFAKLGWLGVSLQYRVQRPERNTTVFDCVRDGRSAVRYLRAHAEELGIDPQKIVAGGRSAGGHVAAGTALFPELNEAGENIHVSRVPNALVLYSAVLDTSERGYGRDTIGERWQELSPLLHVNKGLPPTLVLHGIRDTITPVEGAKQFAAAMAAAGNQCELILDERGSHSYMMRKEPIFNTAMEQTVRFLAGCGIAAAAEKK